MMNLKSLFALMACAFLLVGFVCGLGRFCYDLWVYWHSSALGAAIPMQYEPGLAILASGVICCAADLAIVLLLHRLGF